MDDTGTIKKDDDGAAGDRLGGATENGSAGDSGQNLGGEWTVEKITYMLFLELVNIVLEPCFHLVHD